MRRLAVLGALLCLAGVACGAGSPEALRYYDPWGNFTVDLPPETSPGPVAPQQDPDIGTLLSAVVISEQPEESPPPQFGFSATQQQEASDILQVSVIENPAFATADDMVRLQVDGTSADVQIREPLQLGGVTGLLVVADHADVLSSASVFAVAGGRAYWVWYLFPLGGWQERRGTLYEFVSAFRFGVPASVQLEAPTA